MFNQQGRVLYVGKAKNLKARISSYFRGPLDSKTARLVPQIHAIETTITRNEREALLLEHNLIKAKKPPYNIVFRDDKSYLYLKLSTIDAFPRLSLHRGRTRDGAQYFGPYPNTQTARSALHILQNLFQLRQCDSHFFNNRSRPCLQYQIKRCSAPCVGYIDQSTYQADVLNTALFLSGKNKAIIEKLVQDMRTASNTLSFEQAARLRDQIAVLRQIQSQQIIKTNSPDLDVLAAAYDRDRACIYQLKIREGNVLGGHAYFIKQEHALEIEADPIPTLLSAFLLQHYLLTAEVSSIAPCVLLPCLLPEQNSIQSLLAEKIQGPMQFKQARRQEARAWIRMAQQNAAIALQQRHSLDQQSSLDLNPGFEALADALGLPKPIQHLECFDVSHTQGEAAVVSCVVFNRNGPLKSAYRRFNLRIAHGGDDYAALREALTRRYKRLKTAATYWPDVLIVDGGRGQLNEAKQVLAALAIPPIPIIGIAKGPQRRAGAETLYAYWQERLSKPRFDQSACLLLQRTRDEAHRFALKGHRTIRARHRRSTLENIPGIGPKRRAQMLQYLGGLQEVMQASVVELGQVPGIHRALAERIYEKLHG